MLLVSLLTVGCQCGRPALPPDTDTPTPPTRPPPPTLDTAPEPPCDWVEEEPNNTPEQANTLPLEAKACGQFGSPAGDSDNWAFETDTTTWIAIDVEAEQIGSFANPAVAITGPASFSRQDGDEGGDVALLVPLDAGSWNLTVFEQNLSGGTDGRWFYDLQVSEQKAPRAWTQIADEPNDDRATALPVTDGDAVYGLITSATDEDWLRVDIPHGRTTLTVEAEAFALGSPLDGVIELRTETGTPTCVDASDCRFEDGVTGSERDPFARYTSDGDETIYVRFRSEISGSSPYHWYVLTIALEGE